MRCWENRQNLDVKILSWFTKTCAALLTVHLVCAHLAPEELVVVAKTVGGCGVCLRGIRIDHEAVISIDGGAGGVE